MSRSICLAILLALGACDRGAAPARPACDTLTGANAVQTEMRRLECALQRVVAAIGRDDLGSVPAQIHAVHLAREATEQALESGAWKPPAGDLEAFVALDGAFHHELEAMVEAAGAGDHAGTAAALGRAVGQCQGCHATYRPEKPAP